MASVYSKEPIDILRKTIIVVLMIGAMLLLHRFAVPDEHFDPRGLLALGFVILATYTIGELTEVIGLPHITGYLLAGVLLGPSMAYFLHDVYPHLQLPPPLDEGILSHEITEQLSPLNKLALALIALTAGGELKLKELRDGLVHIVGLLVGQAIPVTLGVVACVWGITQLMPESVGPLSALPTPTVLALAGVVASLAFATSPAATIAIINSTGSKGPMARTVLSTVVLKDVIVITSFFVALAISVGLLGVEGAPSLSTSLGRIGLSIAVGVGLGFGIHFYLRFIGAELLLFIVAMIYTFTFLISTVHGEAPLMFIV
ncbi:MAG TPA: hypothetical protein ENK18_24985, partial [Deltaproteobacteria bacterium]|nr:hypothetical protein [Deltaproteobacteria bacterium]